MQPSQFKTFTKARTIKLNPSRVQRTKSTHSIKRLIAYSNSQGNSFIMNPQQLDKYDATQQLKQQIKNCLAQINQLMYHIWSKGKQFAKKQPFQFHCNFLRILYFVILIGVILGLSLPFDFINKALMFGFFLVLISVIGIVIATLLQPFEDYSFEKEVILKVKQLLNQQNQLIFQRLGYYIRCDKQLTWISFTKNTHGVNFDQSLKINGSQLEKGQNIKTKFTRRCFSMANQQISGFKIQENSQQQNKKLDQHVSFRVQ